MKTLASIASFLLIISCINSKSPSQIDSGLEYRIKKIQNVNSWHIIYATKADSLYKVVVGQDSKVNKECQKIVVGKYYNLQLYSRRENAPEINGVKLQPINYADIECYRYDEETEICIEPKKGIYDLHYASNLKGLCYID
jgi:hypothetical protein